MFKKTVSTIMLSLLVISTLTLAFKIQMVKAQGGTITINADGSISPQTAPIYSADNVTYTLTGNLSYPTYEGVVVERNNVVIDGNGFMVQGNNSGVIDGSVGFDLTRVNNVTIQNTNICGFEEGIYLASSDDDTIIGNNVTKNSDAGVNLYSSSGNNVRDNSLISNNRGFAALLCSNTLVEGNTVSENNFTIGGTRTGEGIFIETCPNTLIDGNQIEANVYDVNLIYSTNDTVSGNNITAASNEGIYLYYSDNNSIWENNASANTCAISLFSSNDNAIDSNNITGNVLGLQFYSTSNNTACNNIITANIYGIMLSNSSSNVLLENDVTENSEYGVTIASFSSNNILENNIINGNNVAENNIGIWVGYYSSNNSVSGNIITDNSWGISLSYCSSNNIISRNNITANNWFGIELDSASNNEFYHNNFAGNTQQVYSYNSSNIWDNGYPSGGNYWSDYNGADAYGGPNQNIPGSDGIGDTPYIIDANNTDHYPLMNPYNTNSPSITILPASSTLDVGQSQLFNSTVSGGMSPYTYQWYLNYAPVSNATSNNWTFTPTSPGSYTVYLNVTDSLGIIATSNTASVLTPYSITFGQVGVGSDYTGTVVMIDGTNYTANDLPASFLWDDGSTHTFAYQSSLTAEVNAEQYVWTGTNGLSSLQSDSITVTTNGTIIGNYKTQYYLTVQTSPSGLNSPTGQGWYDANTYASISTPQDVDNVSGSSRYDFRGWTTTGTTEITDPSATSTTVLMDEAQTVTADYVTQYYITFGQSGIGQDFTGTIAIIDGSIYNVSALPTSFWYDKGSTHSFAFQSALVGSTMTYYWNSTTGLSALQSGSINVTGPGSITGDYIFHEVIVANVTASNTWAYRGGTPTINVTVKNFGDFNESVSVTLYYNVTAGKSINTYPLYLGVGQSLTLIFTWNTKGVPYQNYTLTAVATIPTGSNTLSDGNITIKLLGDVNGDGIVNLKDIALVARAFGSTPASPNWNPATDLNGDGTVNMKDVALVARNFGNHT